MQEDHIKGVLATIIAAMIWSTAGVLIKLLSQDALTILCYRSFYAGIFLLIVFRKDALHFSKKTLYISLVYAPLLICFVTATKLTTAANAIFLQYLAPALVLVVEPRLLRIPMKGYNLLTVIFCIIGLSFFLKEPLHAGQHWLGNGLALVSGFLSAGLILLLRFSNRDAQMSGILLGNVWVVLLTLPWFLDSGPANLSEHLMLGYLGFIQIGLGYVLFTYGQRRLPAIESSLFAMLEPIFNPIWVLIWYGENPAAWSLIGGGIILVSLAVRLVVKYKLTQHIPGIK